VGLWTGSRTGHAAEPSVEPPGADERRAIADLLRLWADEGFAITGRSRAATRRWAEAWCAALVDGREPPSNSEDDPDAPGGEVASGYAARPELEKLLAAVRAHRRAEAVFVSNALSSVGAAFMELVLESRDALAEDARDDDEIARSVAHLASAMGTDDDAALRLRAEHVVRIVHRKAEARRKRSEARSRALGHKMAEHRDALVDSDTKTATDAITELPSRRALEAVLQRECLISQLSRSPASVAKLGIATRESTDREMIDRIMALVATALGHAVGAHGFLGRYSGDEFLVVMPDVDEISAAEQATVWLKSVAARPVEIGGRSFKVPLFAGVAECVGEERRDEWVFRADEAMDAARTQAQRRAVRYGEL